MNDDGQTDFNEAKILILGNKNILSGAWNAPYTFYTCWSKEQGRSTYLLPMLGYDWCWNPTYERAHRHSTKKARGFLQGPPYPRLALFGSVLREDFRPDSDVDVLVEFEAGHIPGLLGIARMERELSALLGGRKVDLRTPEDLSRCFRQQILASAEVHYAQG